MFSNQAGSRRWTHFHSALQLAIQRSAHKWTFEDFAECFPLYVEEDKNGSSATFNSISDYIESQNFRDLDKLFKEYNIQESIDSLHQIVTVAKERKSSGTTGNDTWKDGLDPKIAFAARTVPVLTSQADRLKAMIAEIEAENRKLEEELEAQCCVTDEENERVAEALKQVDLVFENWKETPLDDIEAWTVQTAETLKPVLGS